jgi:hypothetical protein
MTNFSGSFVGFLDTVSDILYDLGKEWEEFGFHAQDKQSFGWGKAFIEASDSIAAVTVKLAKVRDEYDNKVANSEKV